MGTPVLDARELAARSRKRWLRLWLWLVIFTAALWVYPIANREIRLLFLAGMGLSVFGVAFLWRHKKVVIIPWAGAVLMVGALLALPSRPVRCEMLARDYCSSLSWFRGVHYVWGGEGLLGIDCSGLARQGMIWGQLRCGLRTLNGGPIRTSIWLWWHDLSARALGEGEESITRRLFNASEIAAIPIEKLRPGDLAVTADGVHVIAYLGSGTWIEADPNLHRVVEISGPADNPWFHVPVEIVRWTWLEEP
jgi:hypothetical protein